MHVNVVFVMYSWFGHSLFTFLRYIEILLLDFLASEWFFCFAFFQCESKLKKKPTSLYMENCHAFFEFSVVLSPLSMISRQTWSRKENTHKKIHLRCIPSLCSYDSYTRVIAIRLACWCSHGITWFMTKHQTQRFPAFHPLLSHALLKHRFIHIKLNSEVWYEAASQNIKSLNKLRALKQNYDFAIRIGPNQSQCLGD